MSDLSVLYIATRRRYLDEAKVSATSLKAYHDWPVHLITTEALIDRSTRSFFDGVELVDEASRDFADSILTEWDCVADKTLFLDTDTYVAAPLEGIVEHLDDVDLVGCWDPTRGGTVPHEHDPDIPASHPMLNTGVLAYRDTEAVWELFADWRRLYDKLYDDVVGGLNQPAFRQATYEWNGLIHVLPPEYNFRVGNVANSVNYAAGPVRLIHGRSHLWHPADLARRINETHDPRVIICNPWPPEVITAEDKSTHQRLLNAADVHSWQVYKHGPVGCVRSILQGVRGT